MATLLHLDPKTLELVGYRYGHYSPLLWLAIFHILVAERRGLFEIFRGPVAKSRSDSPFPQAVSSIPS